MARQSSDAAKRQGSCAKRASLAGRKSKSSSFGCSTSRAREARPSLVDLDTLTTQFPWDLPMSPRWTDSTCDSTVGSSPAPSAATLPKGKGRRRITKAGKGRNNATQPWPNHGVHAISLHKLFLLPMDEIYAVLRERSAYAQWAKATKLWHGTYIASAPCFTQTRAQAIALHGFLEASPMPEGCEALLEQAYFEARGHKNRLAARTSRARAKARSEKLEADNSALHHENTQLLEQLTVARERLEVLQRENAELSARTLHGAAMQERSPIADLAFKAWTISNETATGCISPLWPADNDDGMNYASYASPRNLGSEHHHLDLLNEMAEDEENPKALFDRD